MTDCDAPGITAEDGTADDVARRVHDRPFGQKDLYTERSVAHLPGQPEITVGLRVPCRSFNLIPVADSEEAAVEAVDAVRGLLREEHG
jgi:hypothetical protein